MSEQDKQLVPLGEQPMAPTEHYYFNIGKPFRLGERMVCWATELVSVTGPDTAVTRKVILDAATEKEIDILDINSHIVHNPHADQAYTVERVVDAERTEE